MSNIEQWIYPFNQYIWDTDIQRNNVVCVMGYMHGVHGWHENAVMGLCGNLRVESTFNPTLWEGQGTPYTTPGFGLVQWTPFRKYTIWAHDQLLPVYSPYAQMDKILYEVHNPTIVHGENFGYQWGYSGASPSYIEPGVTFEQWTTANNGEWSVWLCAEYFLWYYEKPASPTPGQRGDYADAYANWYYNTYLAGGGMQYNYYPYPWYDDDPQYPVIKPLQPEILILLKQQRLITRKGVIIR